VSGGVPFTGEARQQYKIRGVRPRTPITFFVRPKKVIKETPPRFAALRVPCVARLVRRLRNSHDPLRVHVLKQSSPKSPDQLALLGGAQGNKSKSQNQKSVE